MRVFISYSTKDRLLADKLYNQLRDRMISVWIDKIEMRPGDSLMKRIKSGIEASDALLVLVTRNSMKSRWVKKEIKIATTMEKTKGGPRVIPLIVKPSLGPRNLKGKLYIGITRQNLKMYELLRGIYRDGYILRINLNDKDFSVDAESILKALQEYYKNPFEKVHVYIENRDFNRKLLDLMDYSLTDKDMPEMGKEQVLDARQSLPITLPLFWRSIEVIFEQLIMDLYVKDHGSFGTLESLHKIFNSIFEYSFSALVDELRHGIFTYYAPVIGREDISAFVKKYKRKDWHDFICERHGLNHGAHLDAIDLVGKKGVIVTRVWTPPLSLDYVYDLQGSGMSVASSPVGIHWYDEYLPQIIGREIRLITLRNAKLMQEPGHIVGLHPDEYEKAGLG